MDAKLIGDVVAEITKRTVTVEHAHMLRPWEMVLGALILPMLAEEDPAVKESGRYAELMARYDKESVEKMFSTKEAKEVVERVVERVVEVPVGDGAAVRKPTLHGTVKSAGKFRRLKDTVNKVSRKRNDIPPEGLDLINKWWNREQRLVEASECQRIADEINLLGAAQPLSASQVSGWLSWLCRLALKTSADREDYIARAVKRRKFSVEPKFPDRLVNEVADNKRRIAEERERARQAKERMKAEAAQRAAQPAPATA